MLNDSSFLERISSLSPEQRRVLEHQLRDRGIDIADLQITPRSADTQRLPLSLAQERMWLIHRLEPENTAYHLPFGLAIRGPLNVAAAREGLQEIVRRHEALRTVFQAPDGQPVQIVQEQQPLAVPLVDLGHLGEKQKRQEKHRVHRALVRRRFDLASGPLLRALLVRTSSEAHDLLGVTHHAVSDGSTERLLGRELRSLHDAFTTRRPAGLPELKVQYADFALWQRQRLRKDGSSEHLSFWRERLEDAPEVLELPSDRVRPRRASHRGGSLELSLSPELPSALKKLARSERATLSMVTSAAFLTLLHRLTGQRDISVGTAVANRNRAEIAGLIGCFANPIVLRLDLSGDPSFRELLGRMRETTLEAQKHQDLPFEKVVEELKPEPSSGNMPFFQVWFDLRNVPAERSESALTMRPMGLVSETTMFDLELALTQNKRDLSGRLKYSSDLFDATTVGRMRQHLQLLMEGLARDPDRPLSELPLLSRIHRHELLVERNATRRSRPRGGNVCQLFAAAASRDPGATAVIFEDRELSYEQLDRRSDRLANYLAGLSVGPGARVGLYLEHSIETLIAIWGVLKTGAGYVPLDPSHPPQQTAYMVEDAGIEVVLTQADLRDRDALSGPQKICLDSQWPTIAEAPAEAPAVVTSPHDPAYVIYTSGSTGQPKGVEVTHDSLVNYVSWAISVYCRPVEDGETDPRLSFALYSSLAFDLTVTSIYPPLLSGQRVVIYREKSGQPPLLEVLRDQCTDVIKLTPSHLALIADQDHRSSRARRLVVGGEALSTELAHRIHQAFGGRVEIWNEYGPTEATVGCMLHRFDPVSDRRSEVGIGRPAANTRIYVLDEGLRPVPIHVTGELYIAGEALAHGYLNRPGRSAECFLPDPFIPDGRMYRSGDLARWLPEGGSEFLGRRDQQVKFHGYRVELGGIRSELNRHAKIRDSVVVLKNLKDSQDVLVAYYVSRQALDAGDLREFLGQRLIEETLPNLFVHLRRLPLTLNGKINHAALPSIEQARGQLKRTYTAPRTPTEELIAGIWAEVLRVEQVGVEENFFDLGGHSLLATRVISRIARDLGVELPLRTIFEAPTVTTLGVRVEEALKETRGVPIRPPLKPVARDGLLPLSFAQERLWFLDRLAPDTAAYNVPMPLRLIGDFDVAALHASLREIVRRHEVLRTSFAEVDGQPVQVVADRFEIDIPEIDLSALAPSLREALARRRIHADSTAPFDLATGPLIRCQLLRLDARDHVVLFNMHHIVCDGWSVGVLGHEFAELYRCARDRRRSPLPELTVQYADFAAWQSDWLVGAVLEQEQAWWSQELGSAPRVLELPTDRPRPAVQSFTGATRRVQLPARLAQALSHLCREQGATLFMALLAGFQALLSRWSGENDLLVGSPIANRRQTSLEALIGFFVNTLVLRGDLRADPTFRELLAQARERSLGAYAHQDLPFEKLVDELQPERDLSRSPVFQVVLSLQNVPGRALELPDLELSAPPLKTHTAKFDMVLNLAAIDGDISGAIEYCSDLFDATTIDRLMKHFQVLLGAVVAEPEGAVSDASWLSAAEHHQLTTEWSETVSSARGRGDAFLAAEATVGIGELFEASSARSPDAVAVAFEDHQLSYLELNARADQLAGFLSGLGVGPEARVGLYMDHCLEMVIAILGTLKAGAAYVALDPRHPTRQSEFMVRDSGLKILLSREHLADKLAIEGVRVVRLDTEWSAVEAADKLGSPRVMAPDTAAYMIYTSGTTGKPKGVEISHRALIDYVDWAQEVYFRGEELTSALYSSLAFDLTVTSIYPSLLSGNRIVVYRDHGAESPVSEIVRDQRVDLVKLTPSHLALIAGLDNRGSRVRRLIVGGEALSTELASQIHESFGGTVEICNEYGPTEATVGCMIHRFDPAHSERPEVLIGHPAANTRLYILDPALRPVGVNVTGELYISGRGLARGYRNRRRRTASSFLADPFAAGERMYRSGDLARWLPQGEIEFLGRRDAQIKFHGYRVELGGIRWELNQHPKIRDSVVMLKHLEGSYDVLAAYYVSRQALDVEELRGFLRERIIEETIPGFFVHLRRLPLTLNGKVNYDALPSIEQARDQLTHEYVAPRTATEELIAGIWSEVLKVERVGTEESFFDLGGHSLLATQVVSRLGQVFNVELPLRELFAAPSVAKLAARVEAGLRQQQWQEAPAIEPTTSRVESPRVARDAGPPSFAQERLWFLDQLEAGSPFYNVPLAVRAIGHLDTRVLTACLNEIVRRHEALRTCFPTVAGEVRQEVQPSRPRVLPEIDLTGLAAAERSRQTRRTLTAEAQQPFDLTRGPLIRGFLLRLAEEETVVALSFHHIVMDGWSLGVLVRELESLYPAFAAGDRSPLKELPIQYADYARWQRQWLSGQVLDAQIGYWRRQLEDTPVLELPADRPVSAAAETRFSGATQPVVMSEAASQKVRELAQNHDSTLFMVLLTALTTLLHRYSGQTDFALGAPIAGRHRHETEGLIGLFLNTLVLRSQPNPNLGFRELLAQLREAALGAYAHQDLPFEKLVEDVASDRDLSHHPFFQVSFGIQNAPFEPLKVSGLDFEPLGADIGLAKFPMSVIFGDRGPRLTGTVEYQTGLFDDTTIRRLGEHLANLLTAAVEDPERPLGQLSISNRTQRHQLLVEWNLREAGEPQALCLHQLFERQVERVPEAVAVVFEDQILSYRELDRRADRLAHHLRGLGVGPEVLVAICAERSAELVTAILATLKAGGAYVPLDPGYPPQRLAFMMADTGAAVLLTQGRLAGLPPTDAQVVDLETTLDLPEPPDADGVIPDSARPDNIAYTIYTSGSTGLPKGVMVSHRSLSQTLLWRQQIYRLGVDDAVLQGVSFSFDPSLWEFLGPLAAGARLILPRPGDELDPASLLKLIRAHGVSVMQRPPSLLKALLEEAGTAGLGGRLRAMICGGEALSTTVRDRFFDASGAEIHNLYGPAEAALDATGWYCRRHERRPILPIGHAVAGKQIYLVDRDLRPVPLTVAGELTIGGEGLGRGYLHRPALTAERFVPDPYAEDAAGSRLYKTGDRARFYADGELGFLGRADDQVKIRGFRIEPGEIAATLRRQPAVGEAVVLARRDAPGDDRSLVAYLVPDDGATLDVGSIRQTLQRELPSYMVPAAFVALDKLPLTATGKVDREALGRLPVSFQPTAEPTGETEILDELTPQAPRTPAEELMAGIWAEVLGLENVGLEDDFFELGGHSLLATQVMSRLRAAFNVELPLKALFEEPTIAALCARVAVAGRASEERQVPALERLASRDAVPLSLPQQRLWFLHQMEPNLSVYNMFSGVPISGPLDIAALEGALAEVTARHEALRTRFPAVSGKPVQEILTDDRSELPRVDLDRLSARDREAEITRWARFEASRPYNLSAGPLFRSVLLRQDAQNHVLLLGMHHIVSDGWSMTILVRELSAWYQALQTSQRPDLPELTIQYADFAAWQRDWLRDEVLDAEVAFWRDQLSGAPSFLSLPTDRPRPALQSFRGNQQQQMLPAPLAAKLNQLGRQQSATLFMTLLATFQVFLHRQTAQQGIAIGTPIANRNQVELEGLIGFFINTLVLRSDVAGNPTFSQLLGRVRTRTLDVFAHPDLPFEKLVEELQPERDLRYSPLIQTMFVLQNIPRRRIASGDLTLGSLPVGAAVSKFDLTLIASAVGDELSVGLEYNTDLFDDSTVHRWHQHLRNLLETATADPSRRISELDLLSLAERDQVLYQWNDTRIPLPAEAAMHHAFEALAAETPDARALTFENRQLSYRELNRRANRLAHYLHGLGVGPEIRVGVSLERSPELIVSFLAVLKAGGVYLPIDPASPPERLEYLLTDARPAVLLTRGRQPASPGQEHALKTVDPVAEWPLIARESAENPAASTRPENLAYVIYTSGSTGRPKGAQLSHRGLLNLQSEQTRTLVNRGDRVLQFSSLSYDASVFEMVAPLRAGACLVLGRREAMLPSLEFVELLRREAVSWMVVPPSILTATPRDRELPALTTLLVAGEACSAELVATWAPGRNFWNLYGPTETTVWASAVRCHPDRGTPTIGRPIGNTRGYLLDRHARAVPAGVVGELHLGGIGLARGYLRRPRLSAEMFIPDPHNATPGGRLYKTGDLGRLRRDGEIDFAGRADHQIKLRGFRIELGEIENVLVEHPEVRDAVVLVRERRPGDRWLVAYVVPENGKPTELSEESLLAFLQPKLPEHALPGAFVALEALPLLLSGKVHRDALPEPDAGVERPRAELVAPRNAMESTIADIWSEIFQLEEVSVDDNFFDLGGHSLLMVQVQEKLQSALSREVAIVRLFEFPTIRSLAGHLSTGGDAPAETFQRPRRRRSADSDQRAESARRRRELRRARRKGRRR